MLIPDVVWENHTVDGQGAPTAKFAVCVSSDSIVAIELAVKPWIITLWLFGDHFVVIKYTLGQLSPSYIQVVATHEPLKAGVSLSLRQRWLKCR
jgi:hypothetical protein